MYKEIAPIIENTICEVREKDGKPFSYRISPAEGYKLHEKGLDEPIFDKETYEPTGEIKRGYTTEYTTVEADYDWEKNEREIYAVKETEI